MRLRAHALGVALAFACSTSLGPAPESAHAEGARLVVVLVVDQLRPDRLDPGLPGGMGRLVREGLVFSDAVLDHANTSTCPGHAALVTGRHPGPAGVPGNEYLDREVWKVRGCVEDESPDAATFDGRGGISPRALRVTAIGDWLKSARPSSRVFSVSGKARAAVVMGGQRPDGVYWFDRKGARGFTTSRYYADAVPEWVRSYRAASEAAFLATLPERWEHPSGRPANGARRDDHPAETPRFGRTSGHPVRVASADETLTGLYFSPFLDDRTLQFALDLIEREQLGRRDGETDLVLLSLSATDTVGHLYGPWSQEARDALHRLDAALGAFLNQLEIWLGQERLLVALSADHGVLPLPEWLHESGRSTCPIPGGRGDFGALEMKLAQALEQAFGPPGDELIESWDLHAGGQFSVSRPAAARRGIDVERVLAEAKRLLEQQPGVTRVWSAAEIQRGGGAEPFASLYRHSFDIERSGDLIVQDDATCLYSPFGFGTSHGSPYLYDRAIPLVFWGPGIAAGVVRGPARGVDLAPTLAAELSVPTPPSLDGAALDLRPR